MRDKSGPSDLRQVRDIRLTTSDESDDSGKSAESSSSACYMSPLARIEPYDYF